jgi:hypothetical protein
LLQDAWDASPNIVEIGTYVRAKEAPSVWTCRLDAAPLKNLTSGSSYEWAIDVRERSDEYA